MNYIIHCCQHGSVNIVRFYAMYSFQVNRINSIRGVHTTYEYPPVASDQPEEQQAAADDAEVLTHIDTELTQVRQRHDLLFELTRWRGIEWHIPCRVRFVTLDSVTSVLKHK